MRAFIRHPASIPIEVQLENEAPSETRSLHDVSLGGLCFDSPISVPLAAHLLIRVPLIDPEFEARFRVMWCKANQQRFDVGAQVVAQKDAFRTRMVQQACHIEMYKQELQSQQGRTISSEQAAAEWIAQYAANFPNIE